MTSKSPVSFDKNPNIPIRFDCVSIIPWADDLSRDVNPANQNLTDAYPYQKQKTNQNYL